MADRLKAIILPGVCQGRRRPDVLSHRQAGSGQCEGGVAGQEGFRRFGEREWRMPSMLRAMPMASRWECHRGRAGLRAMAPHMRDV